MTRNNYLMIAVLGGLVVLYAIYFADWFRPKTFKVSHVVRNLRAGPARPGMMPSLIFVMGREMQLKDVRLFVDDDFKTNKYPVSLWHLVSDSNSIPLESFFYGQYIRGMRPDIKGERARDLETNVMYRLIVKEGKFTGEHEFKLE